jgi:hypothetical protein
LKAEDVKTREKNTNSQFMYCHSATFVIKSGCKYTKYIGSRHLFLTTIKQNKGLFYLTAYSRGYTPACILVAPLGLGGAIADNH